MWAGQWCTLFDSLDLTTSERHAFDSQIVYVFLAVDSYARDFDWSDCCSKLRLRDGYVTSKPRTLNERYGAFGPMVRRSLQTTEPALTYVPALNGIGGKGAETVAVS
jgi:hypothetical protein